MFPELHQRDVDHRCQKDQLPVEEAEHRTRLAEQVDSEQGDLRDPNAGGRDQTGRCRAESIEGILNYLRFLEGSQNSRNDHNHHNCRGYQSEGGNNPACDPGCLVPDIGRHVDAQGARR